LIRARCAMRRTVAESTDIKSPLGLGVKRARYSTAALAQAMRTGEPKFWYEIFAQTHVGKARRGMNPGFGASGRLR
jgi:hypothetical protein